PKSTCNAKWRCSNSRTWTLKRRWPSCVASAASPSGPATKTTTTRTKTQEHRLPKSLLALTLLAPLLVLVVACGGGGKKSGPPAALYPTFVINRGPGATGALPNTGGAAASSAPNPDLAKMTDAFGKVKSYRMSFVTEVQGQAPQEGKMEISGDRSHMTLGA